MHILDTGPIFKFLTTDCVPELLFFEDIVVR